MAVAVTALHALLAYALLVSFGVPLPAKVTESLVLVQLRPPPPVKKAERAPAKAPKRQGRASPPNLKGKAAKVLATPPVVPLPPPPIAAAPIPALDDNPWAGASPVRGPGNGAGGDGDGTGSGGSGYGDGGGGTPARWLSGGFKDSDYPEDALDAGIGGRVSVRLVIGVKGRVTDCVVTRSSGNDDLDETTCRVIIKRFRYRPALDASGRAVPDEERGEQVWTAFHSDGTPYGER